VEILLSNHQDLSVDADALRALAKAVLEDEDMPSSTEVGIMLVTDEDMAAHNHRFLGGDGPTDVLALPLAPPGVEHRARPAGAGAGVPHALGDVIIAPGYVRGQARRLGTAYDDEMALMVDNGRRHLIGYDHGSDPEAERRESRERHLLAALGMERR